MGRGGRRRDWPEGASAQVGDIPMSQPVSGCGLPLRGLRLGRGDSSTEAILEGG